MKQDRKKPWPTQKAMEQVYDLHLWGGKEYDFYSGEGSHKPEIIEPYIAVVRKFLSSFEKKMSILDLGCGDFNIGRNFTDLASYYIGVDIVPALIMRNEAMFNANHVSFRQLDIAKDQLPKADCIMIRQVLQHLSNNEINSVLRKAIEFQHLILTEHIPEGQFEANLDIISGQGTRLKKGSGVDITQAPFFIKGMSTELLSISLGNKKGKIVTWLILNEK